MKLRRILLFALAFLAVVAFAFQEDDFSDSFQEDSYLSDDNHDNYVEEEVHTTNFSPLSLLQESKQSLHQHPQVRWEELKELLSLKMSGGATFHPWKREILFASNKPGVLQLYTVRFNAQGKAISTPKRITYTHNRCSSPRYLSNGDIMFLHDRGGDENFQIGLIRRGKTIWITNDLTAKHLPNAMSRQYLYFQSNERDKSKLDIYRRRLPLHRHSKPELIYTPQDGIARAALVMHNDSQLVISQHYSNLYHEMFLYNVNTKKLQSITKSLSGTEPTRWQPVRFLRKDHSRILVKTDFKSDFLRYAILEFEGGDLTKTPKFITIPQMEQIKHDVTGAVTNFRTKTTYFEINDNGYHVLLRVGISENGFEGDVKRVELPLPGAVIVHGDARSFGRGMAISRDGKFIALSVTNSVTPMATWIMSVENKNHRAWRLLPNNLPRSVRNAKFVKEHLGNIKSFDGLTVPYFLHLPQGVPPSGGWPTIIKLHGGPESQTKPVFDPLVQVFVRAGFAVAQPNIRGSRGYGKTYMNLDNRGKRMDAIRDIKELAHELPKKHPINSKKLVVMGGSYGGYATLLSVVTYPEIWKAGVDVVGMSNLITFFKNTAEWRRKLRAVEYGDYNTQQDLLIRISPINYVDKARCPVFIIQGTNDERVPLSEAKQIYNKLIEVSKEPGKSQMAKSKLMVFDDEGHGLSKLKNRLVAYHKLLKWLRKNVQYSS